MQLQKNLNNLVLTLVLGVGAVHAETHVHSSEPTHFYEIRSDSRKERQRLADMGYALEEIRSDKVYIVGEAADLEKLKAAGFDVHGMRIKKEWKSLQFDEKGSKYSSYAQIQARMNALVEKAPHLVSLKTFGRTNENRDMQLLRISSLSEGQAEAAKLPSIMYMGVITLANICLLKCPLCLQNT
jgi:hypothetical protein